VLVADPQLARRGARHPVGDDGHMAASQHLETPAIDDRSDGDLSAELLGEFARQALRRVFARLRPPAGQFPLAALVFEKHDLAVLDHHALYRDHHRHRASFPRGRSSM
jgi:hypothetical protein